MTGSEMCHPNFVSNSTSFYLDAEANAMVIGKEQQLTPMELIPLGYLIISSTFLVECFDYIEDRLPVLTAL